MSIVDKDGMRTTAVGKPDRVNTEKVKDMAVIGYHASGLSWREIGRILNVSHEAARKRWKSIPEDVKRYYGRRAMG